MNRRAFSPFRFLEWLWKPVAQNGLFFVMMYTLGIVCAWLTVPPSKGVTLYENIYLELFLDVYVACVVLTLLPRRLRVWTRRLLYVVLYAVSLADVWCFVKYGSSITPSMLMLVFETDSREAGEMLRSTLSADMLFSKVGWVWLIMAVHVAVNILRKKFSYLRVRPLGSTALACLGAVVLCLVVWSVASGMDNKRLTWQLFAASTVGEQEDELTRRPPARLYSPMQRLCFSLRSNALAAKQVKKLVDVASHIQVDSCAFTSPSIVLIIGESYGPHHSQQYGYAMPTTPRQIAREQSGQLVKFSDVVAPWNLTSFVFKLVFSTYVQGQQGEWCDYPLFPQLFRAAGYHVSFLTNQFVTKPREAVYDFSGGFFLNNPTLNKSMFDNRNKKTYIVDGQLIDSLLTDDLVKTEPQLTIVHLLGQHVNYRSRYPRSRAAFNADDYATLRPELTARQRLTLAQYDNATLYNDSVVDAICRRYEQQQAIVIYMPDHGEECYEGNRGFICRNHSADIDRELAHYEFKVPFWIWCSKPYMNAHPDVFLQIVKAKDRRYMTDALAHTLLYLAGIHTPFYHAEYDILSDDYDESRPRILKNTTDYDSLSDKEK